MMAYSQLENSTVSIRRIHEIASLEPEKDPGNEGAVIPTKKDVWPQHGSVVFKDLTFKYRRVHLSNRVLYSHVDLNSDD